MRRKVIGLVVGVGAMVVGAGGAWAFECPARIKDANDAIARAEAKAPNNPDVATAKRWVQEAQKAHQEGATTKSAALHQESAAKAKAAKLLADGVAQ